MESKNYVTAEVSAMIQEKLSANIAVDCGWLTQEYLNTKDNIEGDDLPFYTICAHHYVWDIAKRCVKKYGDQSAEMGVQIVMDGFEHLRKAYPIVRDGSVCLVPVNQCTNEELLARADEYLAMAAGATKHAYELQGYVESRIGSARA